MKVPRVIVAAIIYNDDGNFFIASAPKWSGQWIIPGGHIEYGEKMEDALHREIKEETGLDVTDIAFVTIEECIFPGYAYNDKHMIFLDFKCRAENDEVKLNSELTEYRWVTKEQALKMNLNNSTRGLIEKHVD